MDIDLRRLDRITAGIPLHHPDMLRTLVQLPRIPVPVFMRRNPRRSIQLKKMLHRPGRDPPSQLSKKNRTLRSPPKMLTNLGKRLRIAEHNPDLPSLTPHANRLLLKINMLRTQTTDL